MKTNFVEIMLNIFIFLIGLYLDHVYDTNNYSIIANIILLIPVYLKYVHPRCKKLISNYL